LTSKKSIFIEAYPKQQLTDFSLSTQKRKMPITEVIELIPKENWVKVNRIPQKTEYDTTKDKKTKSYSKAKE